MNFIIDHDVIGTSISGADASLSISSFRRSEVDATSEIQFGLLASAIAATMARVNGVFNVGFGIASGNGSAAKVEYHQVAVERTRPIEELVETFEHASSQIDAPLPVDFDIAAPACLLVHLSENDCSHYATDKAGYKSLRPICAAAGCVFICDPFNNKLTLDYRTENFDGVTAQRILHRILRVADQIRKNSSVHCQDLELLDDEEFEELLARNHSTQIKNKTRLDEQFDSAAFDHAMSIAVREDERTVNYDELRKASNVLAEKLRIGGLEPGELVAVEIARSSDAIAVILGILKAGGAYLPLDPKLPVSRKSAILEIALPRVRLTAEPDRCSPDPLSHRVSKVKFEWLQRKRKDAPSCSEGTAYVLFTSGSTGEPKGVEVLHRNVTRLFETTKSLFDFADKDVWLSAHNFSFDASVWEIFGPLTTGGCVLIASDDAVRDPQLLLDLVESYAVTMLTSTPTAFDGLRDAALASDASFDHLRYVVLCAEALMPSSLKPWFDRWGDAQPRFVNMYGITETTVHSTFHALGYEDVLDGRSIIGNGLPDTPIYVLDEAGALAPFGAVGEIFVGGPGVARRYFHATKRDHERFQKDPFLKDASARMYRSGDLGRRLRNGKIEYLGRRDHQVKLRGHRIELGEIASVAQTHPNVSSARAWLCKRRDASPVLSLAVIARDAEGQEFQKEQLQAFLATRLPTYMVPLAYVSVDALPQTQNGKLDVSKLPNPLKEGVSEPSSIDDPNVAAISRIMGAVLGIEYLPENESFFALGGDSIMAVRLSARLKQRGWQISVADIYASQTPLALSKLIASPSSEANPYYADDLLLGQDPSASNNGLITFPATRLQHAMILQHKIDGRSYQDLHSYTFNRTFEPDRFLLALNSVVASNAALRSSFLLDPKRGLLQQIHPTAEIECTFLDQSCDEFTESDTLSNDWVDAERSGPIDETQPGLFRVFVREIGDKKTNISILIHHAILDGWSAATLVTKIIGSYFGRGTIPAETSDGTTVLQQYAHLERETETSEQHQRFWKDYLDQSMPWRLPQTLQSAGSHEVRKHSVTISDDIMGHLRAVARTAKIPMRTVGFAIHAAVLSFLSGKSSITTGIVTNGRLEVEGGDSAIGLFLNTNPLHIEVDRKCTRSFLAYVFNQELLVQPFRRLPLEKIQKAVGKTDLCNSAFNFTDFHVYRQLRDMDVELTSVEYMEETDLAFIAALHVDPTLGTGSLVISHRLGEHGKAYVADYAAIYTALAEKLDPSSDDPVSDAVVSIASELGLVFDKIAGPETLVAAPLVDAIVGKFNQIPENPAVSIDGHQWSYSDIDTASKIVSHKLLSAGAKHGDRIACFVERGADPIISMIAAWRIGASFVPIEKSLPVARTREILGLAQCTFAVRSEALDPDTNLGADQFVIIPSLSELSCHEIDTISVLPSGATDEAYLLFTSGSTGLPKPISVTHGVLANLIDWQIRQPEWQSTKNVSQFASLSFDVSVQEMTTALCSGCALYIVPEDVRRNPKALLEFLRDRAIDTAFLPPAALRQLASAAMAFSIKPDKLRQIIAAGEQLIVNEPLRELCKTLGACVVNQYGPTETHVVTYHLLDGDPDKWVERVPIGRPINNAEIGLRDPLGRPIYRFAEGELWLLPATNIIPRNESNKPVVMWHRSGDMGLIIDESLVFLGRADAQVKIRGHRVHPGEATALLARHNAVSECVVEAIASPSGATELVAFAVVKTTNGVSSGELLAFLREALPEYSVPSRIEILDKLPTTPRGKTDSLALRARQPRRPRPQIGRIATKIEHRVLSVWSNVIGHSITNPTISFFGAGGTSLNILELYLGLEKEFDIKFPISALFELPTARAFSDRYLNEIDSPVAVRSAEKANPQIEN
ncbi:MAG: amino acid adenylation domain-containing protein [Pseudomonadota bacterium]